MLTVLLSLTVVAAVSDEAPHPRYTAFYEADAGYDATASYEPNTGYEPDAGYDADASYEPELYFRPNAHFEPMAGLVRADLVAKAASDPHGIPVARDVRTVLLGIASWFDRLEQTDRPIVIEPIDAAAGDQADAEASPALPSVRAEQAAVRELRQRYEALAEAVERRAGGDAKGAAAAERRADRHATLADRAMETARTLRIREASRGLVTPSLDLASLDADLDAASEALGV